MRPGEIISAFESSVFTSRREVSASNSSKVMLMLGKFEFSVDTVTYNKLSREIRWRWSAQERIGRQDLQQYTGKEARKVKLEGEAHAFFRNGLEALDDIFDMGEKTEPKLLVSGFGDVLGYWIITDFSDSVSSFLPGGAARRKSFSLTMKHYADDLSNP